MPTYLTLIFNFDEESTFTVRSPYRVGGIHEIYAGIQLDDSKLGPRVFQGTAEGLRRLAKALNLAADQADAWAEVHPVELTESRT